MPQESCLGLGGGRGRHRGHWFEPLRGSQNVEVINLSWLQHKIGKIEGANSITISTIMQKL